MTDDTILSHAEALAEIERLRSERADASRRIWDLQARITELEAAIAIDRGTLAAPTPDDDQPATYTHDVPPNAPR